MASASSIIIRRHQRRGSERGGPWLQLFVGALVLAAISTAVVVAAGAVVAWGVYDYYARSLPAPEQIEEMTLTSFETTKIYDRTGKHLLWEVIDPLQGDRTIVPFSEIPEHMRNATIALEDKTFYTNPGGINFEGIARAFVHNLRGETVQGGSSITAQLVRNVAMDPEERFAISYERKIKEAILSVELTRRYPGVEGRDRILEWYLNTISYGKNAIGVEAAAKLYFGKHARDLTLAEAAMLAAIPQYPAMNPIDNPKAAKERQGRVLRRMVDEGYITEAEAEAAKRAPLGRPQPAEELKIEAPHFCMYLVDVLEQRYGRQAVYGGGLRVISSLDYDLQKQAETIVRDHVKSWAAEHRANNAAAVMIRPSTGEILAMVGSVDFTDQSIDGQVNMATSPRQPGSSFKPYTYAAAFEQGYAPATLVYDVRTAFPIAGAAPYVPENFDMAFHGPMNLRKALACSYNIPAVWLLDRIGIDAVLEMAHRMGITDLRDRENYGPALTLGAGNISLLDHTYGFSVFANGGIMAGTPVPPERREPGFRELDPVSILKVTDGRGNVIDEFRGPTYKEVISPQVAYLITNILSDSAARAPAFGYNSPLELSRPAAVKTGTTNSYMDAWTVGYNPQLSVGVWMGNSDHTPMTSMWGGRGAAPIWHDLMELGLKDLPEVDFVEPPGITWLRVDAESGLLPGPHTRATVLEPFIEGFEPKTRDNLHKEFGICLESGKLATPYCPHEQVEPRVFAVYPPEVVEWQRTTDQERMPTEYCDLHGPNLRGSDASITSPTIYQAIKGMVEITGNARIPGFREYQLEYGEGLQPEQWFPIGGTHHNAVDNGVLEQWDTTGLKGLYTLRLTVRGDQERQVSVPVTVDDDKPVVRVIHPNDGSLYIKEIDEYVLIQVEALDNMAIDRIEYYVDDQLVGESRIAPYSRPWTLTMINASASMVPPVPQFEGELTGEEDGQPWVWRRSTQGQAVVYTYEIGTGENISRTTIIRDPFGTTLITPSGWGAVWARDAEDQPVYQEIHTIHAVAYDMAGNEAESDPVMIYVEHKKASPQPAE
jgi:membrane peptidoglycan carboxypeptidase